jgi:hypothetical protein
MRRLLQAGALRWAISGTVVLAVVASVLAVTLGSGSSPSTRSKAAAIPTGAVPVANSVFLTCTNCHGNLDKGSQSWTASGLEFTHATHFATGTSDCAACHPLDTHQPDQINLPTMEKCFKCHGTTRQSTAPGTCTTCHPANYPSEPASHQAADWVSSAHGQSAVSDLLQCAMCHQQSFCDSCHGGLEMPHPSGWTGNAHVVATFASGTSTCARCHAVESATGRSFCDSCHHPQGPQNVTWLAYHPTAVKVDGGDGCFKCHSDTTCATCHVTGKLDLSDDQAKSSG